MDRKYLFKDNRGISLLELIVVISIMAVLTGAIGIGVGLVSNKSATECAKKMQMAIQRNRTSTMGKHNGRLVVFKGDDDRIYIRDELNYSTSSPRISDNIAIGKSDVTVTCNGAELDDDGIVIEFRRSDGSLFQAVNAEGDAALPIEITKNSRTYEINIDPLTGRVTLD